MDEVIEHHDMLDDIKETIKDKRGEAKHVNVGLGP
jgi:hypothetical protein